MEDFDAPRCPRCLDELGWTKTDNYMAGDTHLVERQLMCPQRGLARRIASGGVRVSSRAPGERGSRRDPGDSQMSDKKEERKQRIKDAIAGFYEREAKKAEQPKRGKRRWGKRGGKQARLHLGGKSR